MRILLAGLVVALLPALAAGEDWKAGVARVKITPEKSTWMSGYASRDRPSEGTEHDLWAKALALQDGQGKRAVLVTSDLVGIERALAQEVCDELKTKHGLPREAIILSTSHTHCGPVVRSNLNVMYSLSPEQQQRVAEYAQKLKKNLVAVVDAALKDLAPAKLSWGQGQATFAVNRRNNKEADVPKLRAAGQLQGPVDHAVPVLLVTDARDKPRAIVFGYACHATVLSYYKWCGDYPGFAQIALEKAYPQAVAMFWAGCGGDQNPLPRRTVELAQKYGQELADAVGAVLKKPLRPVRGSLSLGYREIDLPLAELPTREGLLRDAQSNNRYIAARAKMLLEQLKTRGSLRGSYPYPVQHWKVGHDVRLAVLGGEVVVDYALRLKKELGESLWVMAYANDVMAYIPSVRVLKEGGYEGATSMVYYGMPTVWSPRIEEMIVKEAIRQLKGK